MRPMFAPFPIQHQAGYSQSPAVPTGAPMDTPVHALRTPPHWVPEAEMLPEAPLNQPFGEPDHGLFN